MTTKKDYTIDDLKVPGGFTPEEQQIIADHYDIENITSDDRNDVHMSTALVPVDTSFKVSIPADATVAERLTFMLFMGDSESLWNQVGNTISFVGAVATDGYKRDEQGELILDSEDQPTPCKYTFWRSEDSRLFHAQSMTAYGYLRDKVWPVMGVEGKQGMFLAPLSIKIGQKRTRNGRMTFKFDIVG